MPQSITCVRICFFADLLFRFQRATRFRLFLPPKNGAGFYSPSLSLSRSFFSFFFEAPLAAHHHSRHLKENSAAQPLSSDSLNFLTFLFSKELSNFRPGGLCSPSKAGRLLVASPFPVNSFFQHRVFFSTTRLPPLASLDCGRGGVGSKGQRARRHDSARRMARTSAKARSRSSFTTR